MSSVVFILGAGASRDCGAPLMWDFLDSAIDLHKTGTVAEDSPDFSLVFETIGKLQRVQSKAQLDLNNIESVFTTFELGNVIQKLPGVKPEDIPKIISALKKVIVRTLEKRIEFPVVDQGYIIGPPSYTVFSQLLRKLKERSVPSQTVSVITFNYDIALDIAMSRESLGPDYIVEMAPNGTQQVDLMKLHGSLNWAWDPKEEVIRPFHPQEYLIRYSARGSRSCHLEINKHFVDHFQAKGIMVAKDPVIVPPTWNKADYHKLLSKVWAKAAHHLSEAEYIFIIGYSLPETDAFFRLLYALGSESDSMLRKIIVFNPETSDEVNSRFKKILGKSALDRYAYESHKFNQVTSQVEKLFKFTQ